MRVGHVCRVSFTKFSSQSFLLFLRDATLKSLLVTATVLPHVVGSPADNKHELESQRYTGADGTRNCNLVSSESQAPATTKFRLTIAWCIRFLEDLTSCHVSHTIAKEGRG
jgi:hypothetical protein